MAQKTKQPGTRTHGAPRRTAKSHATRSTTFRPRRRKQTTSEKIIATVAGALPGGGAAKGSKPGKKPLGGLALAGLAGLAFKNRDKLPGRGRQPEPGRDPRADAYGQPPGVPVA